MTSCLRQSDRRWSSLLLGDGPSTIGKSGCLLCCLVEAARRLAGRPDLLPPHANEIARQIGAFYGASLVIREAARALGLDAPDDGKVDASGDMAEAIERALAAGCAIVHVDHDGGRADGDPEGDHFLLAVGFARPPGGPLHVECTDSATGVPVWLSWPDLAATVRWGKAVKHYRAVSVRPVRARA